MLISLLGYCALLAFACLCSASRKDINWRTVIGAVVIQFGFGALVLYVPAGKAALSWLSNIVAAIIAFGNDGILFLFGGLADASQSLGFIFAFKVLPVIIFFSSLISVLYYMRVMPVIVQVIVLMGVLVPALISQRVDKPQSRLPQVALGSGALVRCAQVVAGHS